MLYITNIESNIASILNILAMNTPKKIEFSYLPQLDSLSSFDAIVNLLDEKATRRTIEAVNWREQFPYQPLTTFTAAHSGKNIYIDFFVRCNFLRAENFTNQSKVSEDSCVEFFVEPVPGGEYWNFEFNCIGTVNASHRMERPALPALPTTRLRESDATVRAVAVHSANLRASLPGICWW